jgi:hypothetical protein
MATTTSSSPARFGWPIAVGLPCAMSATARITAMAVPTRRPVRCRVTALPSAVASTVERGTTGRPGSDDPEPRTVDRSRTWRERRLPRGHRPRDRVRPKLRDAVDVPGTGATGSRSATGSRGGATDVERGGVVSPGGVGFDISCGVRLLATPFDAAELAGHLARADGRARPTGGPRDGQGRGVAPRDRPRARQGPAGRGGLRGRQGHGTPRDLERCEDGGVLADADPGQVSERGHLRGLTQVGSASDRATTSSRCRSSTTSTTRTWRRGSGCRPGRCA